LVRLMKMATSINLSKLKEVISQVQRDILQNINFLQFLRTLTLLFKESLFPIEIKDKN